MLSSMRLAMFLILNACVAEVRLKVSFSKTHRQTFDIAHSTNIHHLVMCGIAHIAVPNLSFFHHRKYKANPPHEKPKRRQQPRLGKSLLDNSLSPLVLLEECQKTQDAAFHVT